METLTGIERTGRMLQRKSLDRIPILEHFWSDTHKAYVAGGYLREDESFEDHFDFDMSLSGWFNLTADLDFKPVVVDENEDTIVWKDGNGASLRRHKFHDTTPEHVDFSVKTREDWNEIRHLLTDIDERRINFEGYRRAKEKARQKNKFFMLSGVQVFELMHPVCGHEHMLAGMALDPEWIEDMVTVFSNLILALQETLFAKEGLPDGIWYYEDMGFKERPFMSPAMYRELIFPAHKKCIDFAHGRKLPVVMHSCGFVEPLLPHMVEAGIDCLQVIEVKAGMDPLRIRKNFPNLPLIGGIDVRVLTANDRDAIRRELEAKVPVLKHSGFVLHSDHSIPNTVDYETLLYFFQKGRELGTYK